MENKPIEPEIARMRAEADGKPRLPGKAVRAHRIVRAIARWSWFRAILSECRWYRRLVGGRWERWHIDFPVCSCMWLDVPMDAPMDYREPLWRGTPEREVWLDGPNDKPEQQGGK